MDGRSVDGEKRCTEKQDSRQSVNYTSTNLPKETPQQEGPTCGKLIPCVAARSTNFNKLGRLGGMPQDDTGWKEGGDEILGILSALSGT